MVYFHYYYRYIYIVTLFFVTIILPIFTFVVFLIYDPQTSYQLFFEAKFLAYITIFLICLAISRLINNLRHEKAPTTLVQVLWVLLLTIILLFVGVLGYTVSKQYFTAFQDDIPVQTDSKLVKVIPIEDALFGPVDNSLYGQIPFDSRDQFDRYAIQLKDSNNQVYQTAYFSSKNEYEVTLLQLEQQVGNQLVISLLPHSKRIVSIENPSMASPIYKNQFLLK